VRKYLIVKFLSDRREPVEFSENGATCFGLIRIVSLFLSYLVVVVGFLCAFVFVWVAFVVVLLFWVVS
jgi:hypothetical protein